MNPVWPLLWALVSAPLVTPGASCADVQSQVASIRGRVVDSQGEMPGLLVRVRPAGDDPAARALEAITGVGGAFEFSSLPVGDYVLWVLAPGSETVTERLVHVAESRTTSLVVQVYRGCDTLADERGSLTKADERDAVRLALEDALASELAAGGRVRVFSTANVPSGIDLATALPTDFELLPPDAIRHRAERDGEVWFYAIRDVRVHGGCIAIAVHKALERKTGAPPAILGGAGLMNEFRRTSVGWQKKRVYFVEH